MPLVADPAPSRACRSLSCWDDRCIASPALSISSRCWRRGGACPSPARRSRAGPRATSPLWQHALVSTCFGQWCGTALMVACRVPARAAAGRGSQVQTLTACPACSTGCSVGGVPRRQRLCERGLPHSRQAPARADGHGGDAVRGLHLPHEREPGVWVTVCALWVRRQEGGLPFYG